MTHSQPPGLQRRQPKGTRSGGQFAPPQAPDMPPDDGTLRLDQDTRVQPDDNSHAWNIDDVDDVIDIRHGESTVLRGDRRQLFDDLLSREEHAAFVRSLADDPDLATT